MASGFRRARIATMVFGGLLFASTSFAGPLDPMQFQSLGDLSLTTPGTYVINTYDFNTNNHTPTLLVGTKVYTGVFVNGVAVFDFNSVSISSGATLLVTGGPSSSPVALLSRTTENISGTINVSALGSIQGAGAKSVGVGGDGAFYTGGGFFGIGYSGAGGGGFGGMGGNGDSFGTQSGGVGGSAYANLGSILQGGSPGGYGHYSPGGGGGGAIELGASQSVTVNASGYISAAGGDQNVTNGGGSGGGIFIHAPTVTLHGGLDVHGGFGGVETSVYKVASYASGAGGGGGAILVEYSSVFSNSGYINVQGGLGGQGIFGGSDIGGSNGVFTSFLVPEPSSLILLGTSTLGLIGLAAVRRRHGREIKPRD